MCETEFSYTKHNKNKRNSITQSLTARLPRTYEPIETSSIDKQNNWLN